MKYGKNRKGKNTHQISKVSKAVKKFVHKAVANEPEKKYLNITVAPSATAPAGTFILLNGMVQGTADQTRIADKINMHTIQICCNLLMPANVIAPPEHSYLRQILFIDKQPNNAIPTSTSNILDPSTAGYLAMSPYNINAVPNRYHILSDKTFNLSYFTPSTTNGSERLIKYKVKVNKKAYYGIGNAGDITDIQTNSLYLLEIPSLSMAALGITKYSNKMIYTDA